MTLEELKAELESAAEAVQSLNDSGQAGTPEACEAQARHDSAKAALEAYVA